MKRSRCLLTFLLSAALCLCGLGALSANVLPQPLLSASESQSQLVGVEHTGGSNAVLTYYSMDSGEWREVLKTDALVGKNGIGKTREGDGKTPTGVFSLTMAFGIKNVEDTAFDYVRLTKFHYWCSTVGSEYYNQLVDSRVSGRPRGKSDENLIKCKGYYDYALFIDYNADGEGELGSAIFLHCKGKKSSTSGCIAVDSSVMLELLASLQPETRIVIY